MKTFIQNRLLIDSWYRGHFRNILSTQCIFNLQQLFEKSEIHTMQENKNRHRIVILCSRQPYTSLTFNERNYSSLIVHLSKG